MLLAALAELLCPQGCAGCGATGTALCVSCAGALHSQPARCRPTPAPVGLPSVTATAGYGGVVRTLLIAHKERGALTLTVPLGAALARAVRAVQSCCDGERLALVPVPSTPGARRQRGFDHTRRLAVAAASSVCCDVVPALRVVRRTADQSRLSAVDRAANLAGAFAVEPSLHRRVNECRVVIVDDLMTTGATLAEAARALRAAGQTDLTAAVVAATARR